MRFTAIIPLLAIGALAAPQDKVPKETKVTVHGLPQSDYRWGGRIINVIGPSTTLEMTCTPAHKKAKATTASDEFCQSKSSKLVTIGPSQALNIMTEVVTLSQGKPLTMKYGMKCDASKALPSGNRICTDSMSVGQGTLKFVDSHSHTVSGSALISAVVTVTSGAVKLVPAATPAAAYAEATGLA